MSGGEGDDVMVDVRGDDVSVHVASGVNMSCDEKMDGSADVSMEGER